MLRELLDVVDETEELPYREGIRRRTGRVIPEAGVEMRQIDREIKQVMERVFERAGQQLAGQINLHYEIGK